MKLMKYKDDGTTYIKPIFEKDHPLFQHFSRGSVVVTIDVFESEIVPVMKLHDQIPEIISNPE